MSIFSKKIKENQTVEENNYKTNTRTIELSLEHAKKFYQDGGIYKDIALSVYTEEEIINSQLPKNWLEFCKTHPVNENEVCIDKYGKFIIPDENTQNRSSKTWIPSKEYARKYIILIQLHQLRDCYRQGWVPDWNDVNQPKYAISMAGNKPCVYLLEWSRRFLCFQSKEIAEMFLNNFKSMIENVQDII